MWIEIAEIEFETVLNRVTPFAGVWIEMSTEIVPLLILSVTPFAGVWIEITMLDEVYKLASRHSLRGSVD